MKISVNKIRQEMFMRINQVQVHHDLSRALRDSTEKNENLIKFNRNVRFFSGVESALYNSVVVLLYTLYEKRNDTINFYKLLHCIKKDIDPEIYSSYLIRLSEIKPIWIRVGILRNEMVGHQTIDREISAVQTKANIKFSDIDNLLMHAKKLLSEISSRHFDTSISYMSDSKSAVNKLLSNISP